MVREELTEEPTSEEVANSMTGSKGQSQPLPDDTPAASDRPAGSSAFAADGLVSLEPITHIDALRDAIQNGHPILHDVDLPDWGEIFSPTLCNEAESAGSASARVDRFTAHCTALDRLRAVELVHTATAVLSLALSSDVSCERVTRLFESASPASTTPAGGAGSATSGADGRNGTTAFSTVSLPTDASYSDSALQAFCTRAEYVLDTAEETAIAARVDSRMGNTRRLIGHALTAYIGTPLLLRALLEGRLRFNRWEAVIRKFAWLPLVHLHALDEYVAGLDPRFSLHQFTRKVGEFVASIVEKPVLAARVRRGRRTWTEDLPGGESIFCMKGPTPLIHAHRNEGEAVARAALKGQLHSLEVTPVEKTVTPSDDTDATAADVTTPMSSTDELPPLASLSVTDERMLQQMIFDVLINARPRTETVLEEVDTGDGTTTRYRVEIACPDEATVLRKHAAVVVTVPMTTLLGVDDRPGTIAGTPVPADMARMIASKSTVWYRMLTDPATGQVLDEVALKYEPDRATRIAVQGKWQTCTAPGCGRPALHCEIDHGVPFDHHQPERGGRTEPANLHPLCKRHHQAKTEGRIRMRRTTADEIEWLMPIGTTSTTVAPRIDDGGLLSAACAPDDSAERSAARRLIAERVELDPATRQKAADAVYANLWEEFTAQQEAWDRSLAQRATVRDELRDERRRFEAQMEQQRERLAEREARVDRKALDALRREERVMRDERLLALQRAQFEHRKREHVCNGPTPSADGSVPLKTIIPMRVETFDLGRGATYSVHSPIFPHPAFRRTQERENRELFGGSTSSNSPAQAEWESGEFDVRGREHATENSANSSLALERLATELHDYEESRAGHVTITIDEALLTKKPSRLDLARFFAKARRSLSQADRPLPQADGALPQADGSLRETDQALPSKEQALHDAERPRPGTDGSPAGADGPLAGADDSPAGVDGSSAGADSSPAGADSAPAGADSAFLGGSEPRTEADRPSASSGDTTSPPAGWDMLGLSGDSGEPPPF